MSKRKNETKLVNAHSYELSSLTGDVVKVSEVKNGSSNRELRLNVSLNGRTIYRPKINKLPEVLEGFSKVGFKLTKASARNVEIRA